MLTNRTSGPRGLSRFASNRSGSVAPLIGLMLVMLICCMGLGIDIGRAVLVKARLTDSLDAAGLAVGARLSTTDYTKDARRFVDANFRAGYADATITSVTATLSASRSVISLTASAEMPTVFMKLLGNNTVTVNAAAEITRQSTGLEVALVLDNTGSMDDSMPALRSSAKDLVNILFGDSATPPNLYVSLVPFSQTVNIGPTRVSWVTGPKPTGWAGCVRARVEGLDKSDAPPSDTKFQAYASPPPTGDLTAYLRWVAAGGYNSSCPGVLTPATSSKGTLTTAIDAMEARGATHINLGAVWGWRMLSPKWRGLWGGDAKLPLDYRTKNMSKAVVLMTDGDNTAYKDTYTAYGFLSEGLLGTKDDPNVAMATLNSRLREVCESMKSNGIIIYSVVFGTDTSQATKDLMQACATSTANYFPASDKAALQAAFRAIGDALSNLRISK